MICPSYSFPIPAHILVPHQKPMLLIDRLLSCDNSTGVVEAIIRDENIFAGENGRLDSAALIELMAQSYAAIEGYRCLSDNLPVRQGFLVGMQQIDIKGQAFVGDCLNIKITPVAIVGQFAVVAGEVLRQEETIVTGNLKLWISDFNEL